MVVVILHFDEGVEVALEEAVVCTALTSSLLLGLHGVNSFSRQNVLLHELVDLTYRPTSLLLSEKRKTEVVNSGSDVAVVSRVWSVQSVS